MHVIVLALVPDGFVSEFSVGAHVAVRILRVFPGVVPSKAGLQLVLPLRAGGPGGPAPLRVVLRAVLAHQDHGPHAPLVGRPDRIRHWTDHFVVRRDIFKRQLLVLQHERLRGGGGYRAHENSIIR